MFFDVAKRELLCKVVYYGPPLSGKTTNLRALHRLLGQRHAGHLTVLDMPGDRTQFFDALLVTFTTDIGCTVKLHVFAVPGEAMHAATRRLVLAGAEAVVFVADSRTSMTKVNTEYWHGMRAYLRESGIDPDAMPVALQFNKRDLPHIRSDAELQKVARQGKEPVFTAVATDGVGVLETFRGTVAIMLQALCRRYDFAGTFDINSEALCEALARALAPSEEQGSAGEVRRPRMPR